MPAHQHARRPHTPAGRLQGAADFRAAFGLASAMHEYGDASGAAAIAACARAALASDETPSATRADALRTEAAGWRVK